MNSAAITGPMTKPLMPNSAMPPMVDNILRPLLVGKDTQMPDYIVLMSTIGGMALFGINGFVIGPVIAALFMAAWSLFIDTDTNPPPGRHGEPL